MKKTNDFIESMGELVYDFPKKKSFNKTESNHIIVEINDLEINDLENKNISFSPKNIIIRRNNSP